MQVKGTRLPAGAGAVLLVAMTMAACAPSAGPSPTTEPAKAATSVKAAPTAAPAKSSAQPTVPPAQKAAPKPEADAQAVADFFTGKTVRIIVGYGAGGGFDTYSRAIARHLGKHIPGNPTVIVENMPGAGSMVAANHVYNVAAKDGTVIGNSIGGIVRSQLLGSNGVEFDAAKFGYLGAPNSENSVMITTKASGIAKFEQLLTPGGKQAALGDGGVTSTNHAAAILTQEVLGANIKVVTGYESTAKVSLAMEQGEIDGQYNDWASSKARDIEKIQSDQWTVIGQLTEKPLADLPSVPLILSFAKSEEQRQLLRYGIVVPNQFTRPYFLPPGVPQERVQALQQAFEQTMADGEFLAEAKKAGLDIAPLTGQEVQKLVTDYLAVPADITAKLAKVLPQV